MSRADGKTSEAVTSFLYEETLTPAEASTLRNVLSASAVSSGLTNFVEAARTASPYDGATGGVALSAVSTLGNADFSIEPKGTGALVRKLADGTNAGGNRRGTYAVDWQSPSFAATVASGQRAVISGGINNTCSGANAVISGGDSNVVSGTASVISGGESNSATATYSTVTGGRSNLASATYSQAGGAYSTTRGIHGADVRGAGLFVTQGDAQIARYILRNSTTNATQTELYADGVTASAGTRITLPNNSAYSFTGQVIGKTQTVGDVAAWRFSGTIQRITTAASTALVGTILMTDTNTTAGTAAAWSVSIDADTTNGGLRIRVTGAAATTIRWMATVNTCELGF